MTKIALQGPGVAPGMNSGVGVELFKDKWLAVVGRAVFFVGLPWRWLGVFI